MDGTFHITMGDRGRLVIPAQVRERFGLDAGTSLVLVESPDGLIVMTREQLKTRVRANLSGLNLVEDLLAERRSAAIAEDRA